MVMNAIKTDVLVVGSGLAGSLFSLELSKRQPDLNIVIISKKDKRQSSSYLAQGGIAAVLPETDDTIAQHVQDTLTAGAFTNKPAVVDYFVSHSPEAIHILESYGIRFDLDTVGSKSLALEGGHSLPRVLHHKDFTGKHIMEKLHAQLKNYPNIQLIQDAEIFQLISAKPKASVSGAYVWDYKKQEVLTIRSQAVVLSTGGVGSLFRYTTNPATATGQGIAIAVEAGAKVEDIVNIQFHPTAFWQASGSHLPLISEALRGAGAVLRNESGERFMPGQHPLEDLAPRDIVARSIIATLEGQQKPYVYLDATNITAKEWKAHFPAILKICTQAGIDPQKEFIPVVPAAHYSCGGIATDVKGKTTVEHLYVLGETACTGLHGANRLASNSLLEATLMATGLAEEFAAAGIERASLDDALSPPMVQAPGQRSTLLAEKYLNQIREIMQTYCSVVKTTQGLQIALKSLRKLEEEAISALLEDNISLVNLRLSLTTALMIVQYSLERKENKGVFYNADLVETISKS